MVDNKQNDRVDISVHSMESDDRNRTSFGSVERDEADSVTDDIILLFRHCNLVCALCVHASCV